MRTLWQRRTVRHLVLALLPLLVIAIGVLVTLVVRFTDVARPVRLATEKADATVLRSGVDPDGRGVELRWTDVAGRSRTATVVAPHDRGVAEGTTITIRYDADDPARVYASGDATLVRLENLAFGIFSTVLLVGAILLVTVVHLLRRLGAERRPTEPLPVTYARSRLGLVQRSWLIVRVAEGRDRWVPVHWDPALTTLPAETRVPVHGRPVRDRVVAFDLGDGTVWQSGRQRMKPPRWSKSVAVARGRKGEREAAETPAPPAGFWPKALADAPVQIAAPLIGAFWAFVDGSGLGGFVVATLLAAGVLFWLSTFLGTDPS